MPSLFIRRIRTGLGTYFRNTDWFLFLSCAAASAYGIVLIYSTTITAGLDSREYLIQIIAVIIGFAAAIAISLIDYEIICRLWPIFAGITLILMLLTFTPLGLKAPGAEEQAWLNIPGINVTFQPSELLKITFIITFSVHLTKVKESMNRLPVLGLLILHALVPIALVVLQGENGTAVVLAGIFVVMIVIAGLRPLYMILGLTAVSASVPVLWSMVPDSKKGRILSILPHLVDEYKAAEGYQQATALNAIGSGQLWGVGYLEGGSHSLFARNNDFIFSVSGEEFGFVGAFLLLLVIFLVILALMREIMTARDLNGMLLCGGILGMIGIQSIINIGMNLRLLPVIGITLPFFSRGGSSVGTLLIGIGIALSVYYSSRTRIRNTIFTKKHY